MDTIRKASSSIDEFCAEHGISRAMFYKLRGEGKAPALMTVGTRKLVSIEAAAAWRREREADCRPSAAAAERAQKAARASVASPKRQRKAAAAA